MPGVGRRVALLSVHSCPFGRIGGKDTGGMSIYVREVAHELGNQGFLVDIFTRRHGPEHGGVVELERNVCLVHLKAGPERPIDKIQVYDHLREFAGGLEEFRSRNGIHYDLIYSHYWLSGWAGAQVQQSWAVPHIMMFHTVGALKNAGGVGEPEPELRIESERQLAKACERIIAPTEKEKGELVSRYGALPERIRVIPCGVNMDRFRPMDKKSARQRVGLGDEKVILYVGRIEPVKGIERLLRAASYLDNDRGLRLVIIGGDEHARGEVERLKRLARDLHVEETVDFRGLVEHEALPHFYNAADVCAVASYYESFGLVALESLACGTPVVASDVGIMREIIRRDEMGCVLAVDHNPSALARALAEHISRTASDPFLIREGVSRFGWANIARQVSEVFAEFGVQVRPVVPDPP